MRYTVEDLMRYLDGLRLAQALFWFIENRDDLGNAVANEVFFHLRERIRTQPDLLMPDQGKPHAVNVPGYGYVDLKAVRAIETYYGMRP